RRTDMVDELKKRLSALRTVAPQLNAIADEVNRIVKEVDEELRDMGIGIAAQSGCFTSERSIRHDEDTDTDIEEETVQVLAFRRVWGAYQIHVLELVYHRDPYCNNLFREVVNSTPMPWDSCDRETRLKAFERLPDLLDNIADKAKKAVKAGNETVPKIRE